MNCKFSGILSVCLKISQGKIYDVLLLGSYSDLSKEVSENNQMLSLPCFQGSGTLFGKTNTVVPRLSQVTF